MLFVYLYCSHQEVVEDKKVRTMMRSRVYGFLLLYLFVVAAIAAQPPFFPGIREDTASNFPPPDTGYVPGELIVRFYPHALYLDSLCYRYPDGDSSMGLPPWFRQYLLAQRFSVASIIRDGALRVTLERLGADSLRRMTVANPCADTISITRYGDTIRCTDYLWMVLEFRSDTIDVLDAANQILQNHWDAVELVEPNYYIGDIGGRSRRAIERKQWTFRCVVQNQKLTVWVTPSIPWSERMTVRIFDVQGKILYAGSDELRREGGSQEFVIPPLPRGVYFVQVRIGSDAITQPVFVW